MIHIKTPEEIEKIRVSCRIVKETLEFVGSKIRAGMTTKEVDALVYKYITSCGAYPSSLGYEGFPASACISVNDVVVHGIPSKKRILQEGQIVSYDVGAVFHGWNGDAARTVGVGFIDSECQKLIDVTEQCFFEGVKAIKAGVTRLGDLGHAIQSYAESFGYGVVRELVGHGIGRDMHEQPDVPNYGNPGHGLRLTSGMTIAIEPMITMGTYRVEWMSDGWTVKTLDRKPAAHYENTVAIFDDRVEILSL